MEKIIKEKIIEHIGLLDDMDIVFLRRILISLEEYIKETNKRGCKKSP